MLGSTLKYFFKPHHHMYLQYEHKKMSTCISVKKLSRWTQNNNEIISTHDSCKLMEF